MSVVYALWGDGSLWGDGDVWNGLTSTSTEYSANYETQCHRLSLRINKTGSTEFALKYVEARLSRIRFTALKYSAFTEVQAHRLSVKVTKTGSTDFIIARVQPQIERIRQASFTHEGFVDKVLNSQFVSVRVTHAGSEFKVNHIQLFASRKHQQPVG